MKTRVVPPGQRAAWLAAAVLVVAVFLVFGEVRTFGFIDYDDGEYVFRNQHLSEGSFFERVRWAGTALYAANWHPLTWLSFIADRALFGLDPGWLHVENLALHAVSTVLVLALLVRLTGSVGKSALVAALFALHPLRAESVAWVTERKGLLMALFCLGALHAHVSFARRPTPGRWCTVAALFAGALLAKPQAVTLPLVLLLLDWWPLGRFGRRLQGTAGSRLVLEKLPLLALSVAVTLLTVAAQRQAGALAPLTAHSFGARLANAASAPVAYLAKTLWPSGLSLVYPLAPLSAWRILFAVLVLTAIAGVALRWRDTRPWQAAGFLGFLALLAPVSSLFQAGSQAMADRYTYLPHVPLFVLVIWSGSRDLERKPRLRAAAAAAMLVVVALFGAAAHRQTALWRDSLALFSHAVAVTEGNWKMHYNLANVLDRRGDAAAERHYRLALEARPDYPEALNNLGALYGRQGEGLRAEALFDRAVTIYPGYGMAWANIGVHREGAGDFTGALEAYGRARDLQPGVAETRIRMGRLLLRLGWREEALVVCREALQLAPASPAAAACLQEARR